MSDASETEAKAPPPDRAVPRTTKIMAGVLILCALGLVAADWVFQDGGTEDQANVDASELDTGDVAGRAENLGSEAEGPPATEQETGVVAETSPGTRPADDAFAAQLAEEEARLAERARQASDSPLTPPVTGARELIERWRPADPDAAPVAAQAASLDSGGPRRPGVAVASPPLQPVAATVPEAGAPTHVLVRGSVIPAVLESSIDSDLPGLVRAKVAETVYDTLSGRHVLIPRGSWLVGTYGSGARSGQRRLFVSWTDLLLPDGTPVPLGGTGSLGADGASGVRGRRSTGIWTALGAAVLFDLAGNASEILIAAETGQAPERDALAEALGTAVGNSTSQVGQEYLRELLDRGTRFRVAAGARMNVVVEEDMHLQAQRAW